MNTLLLLFCVFLSATSTTNVFSLTEDLSTQPDAISDDTIAILGFITSYWGNASSSNSPHASPCSTVSIYLITPTFANSSDPGEILLTDETLLSNHTSTTLSMLSSPSPTIWTNSATNYTIQAFPGTTSGITLTFPNPMNMSEFCTFTYSRVNETTSQSLLSGNWQADWQTPTPPSSLPNTFSISIMNNSNLYMEANYSGNFTNDIFFEDQNYVYHSYALKANFSLDVTNNALGYPANASLPQFIYSRNGSLFSSTPFIQNWTISAGTSLSSCCVPNNVAITADDEPRLLNIEYYFTTEGKSSSYCNAISTRIQGGQTSSVLQVYPSIVQLTYVDIGILDYSVKWSDAANGIEITFNDGQSSCAFTMAVASPLHSYLLSFAWSLVVLSWVMLMI